MEFRFYVTDLFDGCVKGTSIEEVAEEMALCEDYYVVDSQTNEWLLSDGTRVEIKELSLE